ncbi:CxxH/CxxC protein [Texcoconibacillus texcoconensis]|uniref:CxxH/CxxC protein (TIGR04129 family) n=1 Tax=Texcoconibacillus texcoconensis TaxID=1095777 RepID=A0A840QTS1_9BACI|nr:CxxH/CxxC protein (TIGR04129 family) [Texcoconibacillus texcoconensis]
MYYSCKEHVEEAIDEVVDRYGVAPKIEELSNTDHLSTTCSFCEEAANYKVSNETHN